MMAKAANMVDYYSTSLEKFTQSVESRHTNVPEKFRYLSIQLKLFMELEHMLQAINHEKSRILEYNTNLLDSELLQFETRISDKYDPHCNALHLWVNLLERLFERDERARASRRSESQSTDS
jgi:hypothetical protein